MNIKYSFLKDPRALAEIRKHKWIESQKCGYEIGFASAAVDWVGKFGQEWKRIHLKNEDASIFIERRRFRRFEFSGFANIIKDQLVFIAEAVNLSFLGLSCQTTEYVQPGRELDIDLPINNGGGLHCKGVVERIFSVGARKYEMYLRFDDYSQRLIEGCEFFRRI